MPLSLQAPGRTLPLAFSQTAAHLAGEKTPYVTSDGAPLSSKGGALTKALKAEGIGPHTIRFSGFYRQVGAPIDAPLEPWSDSFEAAFTLDAAGLASMAHASARAFAESFGKGSTPPEIYLTLIEVNVPPAAPKRVRKPPKRRKRVVYRDRETGAYVSGETYRRSRAAIRGAAKRAGRAPGRGRYVKHTEFFTA